MASSCLSACLSVRVKQLGSHWRDFHAHSYLSIFRKFVHKHSILYSWFRASSFYIKCNKCRYLLLQTYSTCFGRQSTPSSGVHQTVTTASGTGHSIRATTFCQRDLIRPRWQKVVALIRDMTCTRSCSYSLMYS